MDIVEAYFRDIHEIRSTGGGVAETSYYNALAKLLDGVGAELSPKVRCVNQVKNTGAGSPDFGLYSEAQYRRSKGSVAIEPSQLPERGVVEVKKFKEESWVTAEGEQVSRYWGHYGQVLVTNYRDFLLIGKDEDEAFKKLEPLRLAKSAEDFWEQCSHPRTFADKVGDRLVGYLRRVILHRAPLTEPASLAWLLASYAKEARARIEATPHLVGLEQVRESLEGALGLTFASATASPRDREKGEHFFRATLVQTLFYGVFSSWVLWSKGQTSIKKRFNWHETSWNLHVPMIRGLFDRIATPTQLKPLGLDEVLDWAADALNRVDRKAFFSHFEDHHAVQYFYEPFLEAYDPELRKELGVWYTPVEVVRYQVERVDWALRELLGVADGLADPKVHVLDPACGTGAYLVEVLRKIGETLEAKGTGALVSQKLKQAAMDRLHGFEILPAPYVVSHLQLGLLLASQGAPLDPNQLDERVGVFLTNSLTGWDKSAKKWAGLPLLELSEERDAASKVKLDSPILVIIGNPPYNAFAGTSPDEEEGLVDPYKKGLNQAIEAGGWGIKKFNLDDLYVRFVRIAERRIVMSGRGIVSYISPASYLSDPSYVVMREHLLQEFDQLYFDNMNGDSRETGKLTPAGDPDPSVFSTESNKEGIKVGTVISLLVRQAARAAVPEVRIKDYWGKNKRAELLLSLDDSGNAESYEVANPNRGNRLSFFPEKTTHEYRAWPRVIDLCAVPPFNGLMEKRSGGLIDIDRKKVEARMKAYFDETISWKQLEAMGSGLTEDKARFVAKDARVKVLSAEGYADNRLKPYLVRPFEQRWCYYSPVRPLWNEPRPALWAQVVRDNQFFMTRPAGVTSPEGYLSYWTNLLGDNDFQRGHSYYFPLKLTMKPDVRQQSLLGETEEIQQANLSDRARKYLGALEYSDLDASDNEGAILWYHSLAITYSPAYLRENSDGLAGDWPRLPVPSSRKILEISAELGKRLSNLLNSDAMIPGLNGGKDARHELMVLGVPRVIAGKRLDLAKHFDVTAGWGFRSLDGIIQPSKGRYVERSYSEVERDALERGAKALGLSMKQITEVLGTVVVDVYLNQECFWSCIPLNVWNLNIGGYQVIKKWLSYREKTLLGRSLAAEEVEHVTDIVRRLAAILLLQPKLDENYSLTREEAFGWSVPESAVPKAQAKVKGKVGKSRKPRD